MARSFQFRCLQFRWCLQPLLEPSIPWPLANPRAFPTSVLQSQAAPHPDTGWNKVQALGGREVAAQGLGCGLVGFFQCRRGGSGLNAVIGFTVSRSPCKRPVSADPQAHTEVPLGISGVSQLPWHSPSLFLSCSPAAGGAVPPAPPILTMGRSSGTASPLPQEPQTGRPCPSIHPGPFSPALGFLPRHRGPSSAHSTQSCLSPWPLSPPAGRD